MKVNQLVGIVAITLITALPTYAAQNASSSKAAELGFHRIERLVTLRKIEESHLHEFSNFTIEVLSQTQAGLPNFKFIAFQTAPAQGTTKSLEVLLDETGKTVSYLEIQGTDGNSLTWPNKDPITLMENALHYILENGESDAKISPFFTDLSTGKISQAVEQGHDVVKVEFQSSITSKILTVTLMHDGMFMGASVK